MLLDKIDRWTRRLGPANSVVSFLADRLLPQTEAKACHGGGSYCFSIAGSFCFNTACDTCQYGTLYKWKVYDEIVAYGAPSCNRYCTNSCVWFDHKAACGTC
jgi:hypothetical protein